MRDPELVARAQRAATRQESAWEQWRALHGLAVAPGQPVVSYVGYSLKEPWGEPGSSSGSTPKRPEYLAELLDRDECAQRGQQVLPQQAQLPQAPIQQMPVQQMPVQPVPLQSGPLQSGPLQQVKLTESSAEGTGEYFWARLYPSAGRQSADQARDLAGWPRVSFPARWTSSSPRGRPARNSHPRASDAAVPAAPGPGPGLDPEST